MDMLWFIFFLGGGLKIFKPVCSLKIFKARRNLKYNINKHIVLLEKMKYSFGIQRRIYIVKILSAIRS